jgi:hypothetical protein
MVVEPYKQVEACGQYYSYLGLDYCPYKVRLPPELGLKAFAYAPPRLGEFPMEILPVVMRLATVDDANTTSLVIKYT